MIIWAMDGRHEIIDGGQMTNWFILIWNPYHRCSGIIVQDIEIVLKFYSLFFLGFQVLELLFQKISSSTVSRSTSVCPWLFSDLCLGSVIYQLKPNASVMW